MDKIESILTRGVEKIYPSKEALEKVLRSGKKIKLYLGIDPSNPQLHLGNAVPLKKLHQFQEMGHKVILLVGDFTGMIGDPTDKSAARKKLSRKQVLENAKTYKEQASKILRFSGENSVEMKFNSEWLGKLTFSEVVEIASNFTLQQMIERDFFQRRISKNQPIFLHEFFYPLMQAYDSIAMDVDLEVGGSDQIFNMLCGRTLMKAIKGKEKFVLAVPLLIGTDGQKMGKSLGNFIALTEPPSEMFNKVMSVKDELITQYFELCTEIPLQLIKQYKESMQVDKVNPMDLKKKLAFEIVKLYHSEEAAKDSQEEFERVFQRREEPLTPIHKKMLRGDYTLAGLIYYAALVTSKGEAKRYIEQGGVDIDGKKELDPNAKITIKKGEIRMLKLGKKRKFIRIEGVGEDDSF